MRDGFKGYDSWKLMSPEDEEDERERKRLREEHEMDRADYEHDRIRDEGRDGIDLPPDPTDYDSD